MQFSLIQLSLLNRYAFFAFYSVEVSVAEAMDMSKINEPWPPVHENFATSLAFHAHRAFTEYFADLFEGRRMGKAWN